MLFLYFSQHLFSVGWKFSLMKKKTVIFFVLKQIERWWRELHERLEKYFKEQLLWLKGQGHYNPHDETDRFVSCIEIYCYK